VRIIMDSTQRVAPDRNNPPSFAPAMMDLLISGSINTELLILQLFHCSGLLVNLALLILWTTVTPPHHLWSASSSSGSWCQWLTYNGLYFLTVTVLAGSRLDYDV